MAREDPTGEPADENPWATGLTGPQRTFPVWDGVPGYEFQGRRSARRPRADHGPAGSRGPASRPGPPGQFRYTPTVSQPAPVPPLAWPRDEQAVPGFEFDPHARTAGAAGPVLAGAAGPAPAGPS